jgi:hypothetical protein
LYINSLDADAIKHRARYTADSPDKEYYYFRCYDVTSGPSEEELIWKVEPQVAAQIFEHFLQRYFDLIVTRVGTKYYFKHIQQMNPEPKGGVNL